jgi:AraC family transcriptional regulator
VAVNQQDDTVRKQRRAEYMARINRVIDYIETNLDGDLSLSTLAGVAYFSPFHFHRIFRAFVGETLNQFIQRIRLERAATQLIHQTRKSITEIAFDCGFSGSATFARAFREGFGMSASQWRGGGHSDHRKIRNTDRKDDQSLDKIRKEFEIVSYYIDRVTQNPIWRLRMKDTSQIQVEVKDMPELTVAYVRHIGPYKGDTELFGNLFGKLMKWAGPRGLLRFPETRVLAVYHDHPDITEEAKLRTSACITVPEDTQVEGEIGKMTIPGGKYALARFEIGSDEFEEAWNAVYAGWLPESGYQPDDRPCYEVYYNDHREHPEKKHVLDICVSVKPM